MALGNEFTCLINSENQRSLAEKILQGAIPIQEQGKFTGAPIGNRQAVLQQATMMVRKKIKEQTYWKVVWEKLSGTFSRTFFGIT